MRPFIRPSILACLALLFVSSGCGSMPLESNLPSYTIDQTDSARAGYRRTTITSGGTVFVHDFEEHSLILANLSPTQVVGRYGLGNGGICAIDGQSPAVYLAV